MKKINKVRKEIMNWEILAICVSEDMFPQYDSRILSLDVFNGFLIMLNT